MGMYNEVFTKCECGKYAYMQIPQIVLGFGGFYLEERSTLEELSNEELFRLKSYVINGKFTCECGNYFNPYAEQYRDDLIDQLFKKG